jgi:hypothetical protein
MEHDYPIIHAMPEGREAAEFIAAAVAEDCGAPLPGTASAAAASASTTTPARM